MPRHLLLLSASLLLLSCGGNNSGKSPVHTDTTVATQPAPPVSDTPVSGPDGVPIIANDLPRAIAGFVPEGYVVLDTSAGNLNLDAYPDMILVLKETGEESKSTDIDKPVKRPLLILTGGADGRYQLAGRNDNTVYCYSCGGMMGDPFTGVTIKNGYFSVEHYGGSSWRWTRIVTFKYSPEVRNWLLHKDGSESFNATDPETVKTKVRTTKDFGTVPFWQFDIYAEDAEAD